MRHISVLGLVLAVAFASIGFAQARHQAHGAQTFVICTGYGLVRITVDQNGDPVEHSIPCPDCVVTLAAIVSDTVGPVAVAVAETRMRGVTENLWSGRVAGLWHRSRAPPLFV